MSVSSLSSRAIIGEFYSQLEAGAVAGWVDKVGMKFRSDQASEEYRWLGMTPAMREFIGGKQAKALRDAGIVIPNKKFEATLAVSVDDLRRDKTDQIMVRVGELADRANQHWNKLTSTMVMAGESTNCYDGQYFFDTDHSEGDSGSQSNDLVFDISDDSVVSSDLRGTATNPSPNTIQAMILKAVQAILGFKDDQGEPMNEAAQNFLVMVPTPYMAAAAAAVTLPMLTPGQSNVIPALQGVKLELAVNPRLTWTSKLAVFRTDGRAKPFILQEEVEPTISALAEGSDEEFNNDQHLYSIKAIRNVGFGYWQHGCLVTGQN